LNPQRVTQIWCRRSLLQVLGGKPLCPLVTAET
jgi:hypothetical protein